jgi:hypothetical protein
LQHLQRARAELDLAILIGLGAILLAGQHHSLGDVDHAASWGTSEELTMPTAATTKAGIGAGSDATFGLGCTTERSLWSIRSTPSLRIEQSSV